MATYLEIIEKYGFSTKESVLYLTEDELLEKVRKFVSDMENRKKEPEDYKNWVAEVSVSRLFQMWVKPLRIIDYREILENSIGKGILSEIPKELLKNIEFGYSFVGTEIVGRFAYAGGMNIGDIEKEYDALSADIIKKIVNKVEEKEWLKLLFNPKEKNKVFMEEFNVLFMNFFDELEMSSGVQKMTKELTNHCLQMVEVEIGNIQKQEEMIDF